MILYQNILKYFEENNFNCNYETGALILGTS